MHRANVFDLITNKPNQYQWVQERTINALNESHRHINVKYDLNHDSIVQWQWQKRLFKALTYIQYNNYLTLTVQQAVQQTKWRTWSLKTINVLLQFIKEKSQCPLADKPSLQLKTICQS